MKHKMDVNFECNTFAAKKFEDVAMVYFKDKLLMNITDLSIRDKILSYLDLASKSSEIKIVILFGAPETKGCEEYFDKPAVLGILFADDQFFFLHRFKDPCQAPRLHTHQGCDLGGRCTFMTVDIQQYKTQRGGDAML